MVALFVIAVVVLVAYDAPRWIPIAIGVGTVVFLVVLAVAVAYRYPIRHDPASARTWRHVRGLFAVPYLAGNGGGLAFTGRF